MNTCENCFSLFKPHTTGAKRFCCLKCAHEWRTKDALKHLEKGIELYKSGMGFARAGKAAGMDGHTLLSALKRLGHFEPGRKSSGGFKKPPALEMASRLIMSGYRSEAAHNRRMDDERRYGNHPEVNRCRATKAASSKYSSLNKQQRRERNAAIVARRDPVAQRTYMRNWRRHQSATNPLYRLRRNLSVYLSEAMSGKRGKSIVDFVGMTILNLRAHIESQFKRGMSWDNYGSAWQVDHILPVAKFDHSRLEQVMVCWNWQNLRPMFAQANLDKGDKITEPQQPLALAWDAV